MSIAQIKVEVIDSSIALITVDNESRRNAMTLSMWESLPILIKDLENSKAIRVIVLQGKGEKAFISGADINEFEDLRNTPESIKRYNQAILLAEQSLHQTVKPVIGLVRGVCFGGGLGILAACDLRYGADNSRFCMPAAKVGLGYDIEGMRSLLQAFGVNAVAEMFYTAKVYNSEEALQFGLVQRIFPLQQIDSDVMSIAKQIASNAPLTQYAAKMAIRNINGDKSYTEQQVLSAIDRCFSSLDYKKAQIAFKQKKIPIFIGE